MGREIRRVPKGWEHPRDGQGRFRPLYDESYEHAARAWMDAAILWDRGEHPHQKEYDKTPRYYWEWDQAPPDPAYYRPSWTAPADCYQLYETVSEGTPVSPVFDSIDAMIAWMTSPIDRSSEYNAGADWQSMQGMSRDQAEGFCKIGSSPSLVVSPGAGVVAGHRFHE